MYSMVQGKAGNLILSRGGLLVALNLRFLDIID